MQDLLKKNIQKALEGMGAPETDFVLEHPADLSFGDYATNAALVAAKDLKKNPREVAEMLVGELERSLPEGVSSVSIAGPGFINFSLTPEFFQKSIADILEAGDTWGSNASLAGKKVMLEYTDPNPFKDFHIGHLMSNTIGESISRLVEFSGAEVKRANYQGDVGMHVAKALWGMMHLSEGEREASAWGRAYALGATAFEDDEKAKEEIQEINKKVYERSDEKINALYDEGRAVSLAHFEKIYKKLGTRFDFYFFETESAPIGTLLVQSNIGRVFSESEGAVVFDGAKAGLHTRVFLNSQGLPTYEAKELGLAQLKQERWPHDISIVITANEINEYFRVLISALSELLPDIAKKIRHVGHGFLRLPSGKMSSRTGSVVTGESLLLELEEAVEEKIAGRDVSSREEVKEAVAVSAIKFAILKQSSGKDIIFDKEQALSFEGDSGPYLEYGHVRASAILERAKEAETAPGTETRTDEVAELERLLYRFPEVVARSADEYDPHYVTTYLTELTGVFNSYYGQEKIVDMSAEMPYKVALTKAYQITMRNGLSLLGIKPLQRM